MGYLVEMKEAVIQKALLSDKPQYEIAKEAGIGRSTLQKWLKQNKETGTIRLKSKEKRPNGWTPEERFAALIETGNLSDEERAAWCRKNGIYPHHLEQWKADAMAATNDTFLLIE